jgi:hypothetical protein
MSRMRITRNLLQLPVFGLGNLRWVDVRDSGGYSSGTAHR